ncbi:MAG: serine hydrolase [Bacteroidales bacterium]|jgi:beta-glucosidase-like glycosyl hydrolase/CubicO group peptidase (beta-lactamase class C family)|nr:serine hydrolase [Bacteroidales bacterium]
MKRGFTLLLLLNISTICLYGQVKHSNHKSKEHFVNAQIKKMTLKEKVGQLIITACDSDTSKGNVQRALRQIDSCNVGGICFFGGTQNAVWQLQNVFSQRSKLPLFFAIDGEWGLGMRLRDGYFFPRALALGALDYKDTLLLYEMGKNIAKQCLSLGININFAPVLDINLNYLNPIINSRSFGEDKQRVAVLSSYYIKGLQSEGVMAVAKHFPGHGDTETDSHLDLPIVTHSRAFIDSVDVFPFKYNIKKGLGGIMVAHLAIPALSSETVSSDSILPSSLNGDVIKNYLVKSLKYEGLIFTDGLNMKGITKYYGSGQAAVLALEAGADVLLMPNDCYAARDSILAAVKQGRLTENDINAKCSKILKWKYEAGLFRKQASSATVQPFAMSKSLLARARAIDDSLSYHLLTLLRNDDEILPLKTDTKPNIFFIPCDSTKYDTLLDELKRCYNVIISDSTTTIADNDIVLLAVGGKVAQSAATNYGVGKGIAAKADSLARLYKNNVLLLFANPYVLRSFNDTCFHAILVAYQTNASLQRAVGRALFEKQTYTASLPVTASDNYVLGDRYEPKPPQYDYSAVAKAGLDVEKFRLIDSIASDGIKQRAYPGCQIAVWKDGTEVFNRNYGFQTYDSLHPITDNSVFDLASLTKVLATTLSVMKLYENGEIDLDKRLSDYLPYLKKTNKKKITIKEVMSHCARLKAYYPFYREQIKAPDSLKHLYNRDYVISKIADSDLGEKHKYLYSDLGFILLGDLIEKVSGKPLDEFVGDNFYIPMGLERTMFNPKGTIADSILVPTENDTLWRKKIVRGEVHDQTACLMGGVGGHAGLFSTAKEVTALCQVLLNGSFGGKQYLNPTTISTFNHRYFTKYNNRRALGFDKPFIKDVSTHCSKYASQESFGHSGFTGTYLWIDPAKNLIYVFLSNRVYPQSSNNRLATMNIRTDINDLIYESLPE